MFLQYMDNALFCWIAGGLLGFIFSSIQIKYHLVELTLIYTY